MSAIGSIDSIAAFSTAQSLAEVQFAASAKVLKLAQGQDQVVADLVSETMAGLEQMIEDFASGLGESVNTYA